MHKADHLRFKISQLRQDKVVYATEAIAVFIFCLFVSLFLPNLLLRYVYTDPNMAQVPKIFEYIPVATFAVGVIYFLYAMISNFIRFGQVKKLEKELDQLVAAHGDHNCEDCTCAECSSPKLSTPIQTESLGLMAEKMSAVKLKRNRKI